MIGRLMRIFYRRILPQGYLTYRIYSFITAVMMKLCRRTTLDTTNKGSQRLIHAYLMTMNIILIMGCLNSSMISKDCKLLFCTVSIPCRTYPNQFRKYV